VFPVRVAVIERTLKRPAGIDDEVRRTPLEAIGETEEAGFRDVENFADRSAAFRHAYSVHCELRCPHPSGAHAHDRVAEMQPTLPLEDGKEKVDSRFVLDYPEAELVFALVYAVGTEYRPILEFLKDTIRLSGYSVEDHHVSEWFPDISERLRLNLEFPKGPEHQRITSQIEAGNKIREATQRADIFALISASKLFTTRDDDADGNPMARRRAAHVIASLKRPEEVEALRKIYGPAFFLIGIFSDEAERLSFLTNRKGLTSDEARGLVERDQKEKDVEYGQRMRDTFQMSDIFVGADGKQYEPGLTRFLHLVLGDPFSTPTRDEHSMFLAYAASVKSGDLARQVGAALSCADGDVISLGCNDVPAPGGGLYCADHGKDDRRDHAQKSDPNDVYKQAMIDQALAKLQKSLEPHMTAEQITRDVRPLLAEAFADVTEFGRAVHAEMDALMAAGRIGVSFRDSTLYTTTFPCHNCTRHIIAAGVKRVVYIEPYPKSRAKELHSDAIMVGSDDAVSSAAGAQDRIPFEPFLGIGPRRFFDLFSMKLSSGYAIERKNKSGMIDWDFRRDAKPRVPLLPTSYLEREQLISKTLSRIFSPSEEINDAKGKGASREERPRILESTGADGKAGRGLA
jgi:deoxycytidylate deaminase